jgi:hypothetical protein
LSRFPPELWPRAKDTAKVAMADAYQGLKTLIKEKFGHDNDVAEAIDR